jgi:hypothetical protein
MRLWSILFEHVAVAAAKARDLASILATEPYLRKPREPRGSVSEEPIAKSRSASNVRSSLQEFAPLFEIGGARIKLCVFC